MHLFGQKRPTLCDIFKEQRLIFSKKDTEMKDWAKNKELRIELNLT